MEFTRPQLLVFDEPLFLVFFGIVFIVHWQLRRHSARKLWLLAASYLFYGAWDWRFLSLILISTLVDFVAGNRMSREAVTARERRHWLILSLIVNLGILAFFKYWNFFIESAVALAETAGVPFSTGTLEIVLPVGISFYTFQTMSYTLDIYRGRLQAVSSLADFGLFVAFFPQLVAGPIVRAAEFLPQLEKPTRFRQVAVRSCLLLFLSGMIKKACIADNVAQVVDPVFATPAAYANSAIWLAVLFFAVQIYCDFSGYSEMAIGCAGLLGYRLPQNFAFPYLAANISEFWHRWHITLSTWLRDYLYIPLGGSYGTAWQTARNLMITMTLGGLWHGADWNFVLWGAVHGLLLIAHRLWRKLTDGTPALARSFSLLGPLLTFYCVCVLWILFKAGSLDASNRSTGSGLTIAGEMLRGFVLWSSPGDRTVPLEWAWAFLALAVVHAINARFAPAVTLLRLPAWAFSLVLGCLAAIAWSFAATQYEPFIYFQF